MTPPRLDQLQAWLAESPDDSELRYALAMEYRSLGNDIRAVETLQGLIANTPAFVASYLMLGQLFVKLARDDEARTVLREGIAAAHKAGNEHAQSELQALLDSLE
jgi:thioredoxin-like negative regulator of GroEL